MMNIYMTLTLLCICSTSLPAATTLTELTAGQPWSKAETSQVGQLLADPALPPTHLEGRALPTFTLLGGTVYYASPESSGESRLRQVPLVDLEAGVDPQNAVSDLLQGRSPFAWTLHSTEKELVFWDTRGRELVFFDPKRDIARSIPTSLGNVTGVGVFAGGGLLVSSLTMRPIPVASFEKVQEEEDLSNADLIGLFLAHRDEALFLMDPDFSRPRAILGVVGAQPRHALSPRDRALNRYHVRMSPDRRLAAVFSTHLPGIVLVSEKGEILETILHPGHGRVVDADEPAAELLQANSTAFYQTDVTVGRKELVVADSASRKIWVRPLQGGTWRAFEMPAKTRRLQEAEGLLYLLDASGVLTRYEVPEE